MSQQDVNQRPQYRYNASTKSYDKVDLSSRYGTKSRVATGLFGILLGGLGVHNFYLGFYGRGAAQLLLTVFSLGLLSPLTGLWGFIEGILYLTATTDTRWSYDAYGMLLV